MPRSSKSAQRPFRISLPATSANLGPAFDAAALAFDRHLTLEARPASQYSIQATGRDAAICGNLDNHLILVTYREVLQDAGRTAVPLASHFGNLRWTDARIVGEASRREHHPDNASACWMGGLTVARMSGANQAQVACIRPKGKWPLLLAVPPDPLSTEEARRVLPAQYSRADAVANIQNSMLLLAAFLQGRTQFLGAALEDRIHQPYR